MDEDLRGFGTSYFGPLESSPMQSLGEIVKGQICSLVEGQSRGPALLISTHAMAREKKVIAKTDRHVASPKFLTFLRVHQN